MDWEKKMPRADQSWPETQKSILRVHIFTVEMTRDGFTFTVLPKSTAEDLDTHLSIMVQSSLLENVLNTCKPELVTWNKCLRIGFQELQFQALFVLEWESVISNSQNFRCWSTSCQMQFLYRCHFPREWASSCPLTGWFCNFPHVLSPVKLGVYQRVSWNPQEKDKLTEMGVSILGTCAVAQYSVPRGPLCLGGSMFCYHHPKILRILVFCEFRVCK